MARRVVLIVLGAVLLVIGALAAIGWRRADGVVRVE